MYTEPDAASIHVHLADQAVLLSGAPSKAYLDGLDSYHSTIDVISLTVSKGIKS